MISDDTYHTPVLLKRSVDGLNIKADGVYVDLTFGGGGHSREILKRLENGQLIGFDQDADAERNIIDDKRFIFVRHNFRFLKNFLRYYGFEKVDGIIGDFGVSSQQLDDPKRGFSFRSDAELDMRMNKNSRLSAIEVLNNYSEKNLVRIFNEYGEIGNANKLTSIILAFRAKTKIRKTLQFVEIIKPCIPEKIRNKYLAKVFQALRYEVTGEVKSLIHMLLQAQEIMVKGGRICLISYNSIEDRLVKNFFRSGNLDGEVEKDIYGNYSVPFKAISKSVIIPDHEELKVNPRSKSAKLRIAEKIK